MLHRAIPLFAAVLSSASLAAAPAASRLPGPSAQPTCAAEQAAPLLPRDPALCARLAPLARRPGALPLEQYEALLGDYLRGFCHRDERAGWARDKRLRDTGPFTATLDGGAWSGRYFGTHAPVVVWYSPEMVAWLKVNRPDAGPAPKTPAEIPDGALMIKEMFPPPAAACAGVDDVRRLLPTSGAAVMVRAREVSKDGWFWGWFGWSGWNPDYPTGPHNRYPYMGFGQYCVNCHASAEDNLTFASLANVQGFGGRPLAFLSQNVGLGQAQSDHHRLVALPSDDAPRLGQPLYVYNPDFTAAIRAARLKPPTWESVARLPSETYDNVWVRAGGAKLASQFVTSDQCLGCHDAGSTGLQFDMTAPNPHGSNLLNLSPYATWRTSPMGLGGRDPIFFAQLASETQTFHPKDSALVQDTCLGCHGILGQRQRGIDQHAKTGDCGRFLREFADAVPFPPDNPTAALANYGALARDGISCTACHHMLVGQGPDSPAAKEPQNACVRARQDFLNPDLGGFARTFTGSFLVGRADELGGPFEQPKVKPMETALGITPKHDPAVKSSELCGTCHTVHLPILRDGALLGHTYEQTTYPEWAFSAYRTGATPQGPLPGGAGAKAESCQGCHMPSKDPDGKPSRSRIASIQEHSSFPQAENALGPDDIDLKVREGFARHTLVGLNVFFVKMAQQFPDVLGIRTQDPMLVSKGLDPLLFSEQAMLDQASNATATIALRDASAQGGRLSATVAIQSLTGHKFPSGVGFRRAFVEFSVLDALGNVLWASGRTNGAGVIVDADGKPIAGEFWWTDDCSSRVNAGTPFYQPHYSLITRQDQAQIYQELVTAPAPLARPACGERPAPGGALTTSFLSICGTLKDNRILPDGFLPPAQRLAIARALGAGEDLVREAGAHGVGEDPDYVTGGGDSLRYEIPLADLGGQPASVRATLHYQSIPPFYLQDRFCTARGGDAERLYFLAGHLNVAGTAVEDWRLEVVSTGPVSVN